MAIDPGALTRNPNAKPDHEDFDMDSGNFLEHLIFKNRVVILILCAIITTVAGWSASKIAVNADFLSMLPRHQPFVINYENHSANLRALGDSIEIVVENKDGNTIYDPAYLETLQKINDAVFLIPGVDAVLHEIALDAGGALERGNRARRRRRPGHA